MPWVSRPPTRETQAIIDDFNTFRGGFLNSYAQMEFTVGRLLSRFNATSPFIGSQNGVNFRFESRLDAFEKLLEERNELREYCSQGLKLCSRLRATDQLRNYFAHGIVRYEAENLTFTIRRILPSKEDPWKEVALEIDASEIAPKLSEMSLLTQEFMYFARELSE
ncbi:MAG: hypothetical protein AAF642_06485 [Pseudomonadota bacterium]